MHFTRLRLVGFKSFVEPIELLIEPGLTGIIGPNGCGKSNLVEALRWVMGEASAKKMRGNGMDDVIFNGSGNRPPRNIAEVSLRLDNADRSAPSAFNDSDELEVVRRIARESGSNYSINGVEARAKDVQLMFADLSTGAHSTALVSQGEIGMLVQAKPTARRALIEEAAGITGLHSRRHEAELRLKAAETNLERLADVVETMEGQHRALKRQARQAARYSNLSRHIRTAEARLFLRLWTDALAEAEAAHAAIAAATDAVAKFTGIAVQASSAQLQAQEKMPALRQSEAEAAARLHRLTMERENLDRDEELARAAAASLQDRIRQVAADQAREKEHAAQAQAKVTELNKEQADQEAAKANEAPAVEKSSSDLAAAAQALSQGESQLDTLTEALTAAETGRASLLAEIDLAARRTREIEARVAETKAEQAAMGADSDERAQSGVSEFTGAQDHAAAMTRAQAKAEDDLAESQAEETAARETFNEVQFRHNRVTAQAEALTKIFGDTTQDEWPAIADGISVQTGYETALGAALGDDLSGSPDTSAPVHWTLVELDSRPPLPPSCKPLSDFVEAPPAVRARLSQIGVIDEGEGEALRAKLSQGQRLVTRTGGLWRWDGFTSAPGATTVAAVRLEQRNRLEGLVIDAEQISKDLDGVSDALRAAADQTRAAHQARDDARAGAIRATSALAEIRDAQTEAISQAAARAERAAALIETLGSLAREAAEVVHRGNEATSALADLPDADALRARVQNAREKLGGLRSGHRESEAAHQRLAAGTEVRARRLTEIGPERAAWSEQAASATRHLEELGNRLAFGQAELKTLEARPGEIAEARSSLLSRTEQARAARNTAADNLAQAEAQLATKDRLAKQATGVPGHGAGRYGQGRIPRYSSASPKARSVGPNCRAPGMRPRWVGSAGRSEKKRNHSRWRRNRSPAGEAEARARLHGTCQFAGRGRGHRAGRAAGRPCHRARRFTRRDSPPAPGDLHPQPRRPPAHARGFRKGRQAFSNAVRALVQRRRSPFGHGRIRRPAGNRAGNHGHPARQTPADLVAAVWRRTGVDRDRAQICGVYDQSGADLCDGRSGRPAGRRQRGAVLRPG